jgi:hypothetical protein
MTTTAKKKSRLSLVLVLAVALGASSATLSGTLAALATQQESAAAA